MSEQTDQTQPPAAPPAEAAKPPRARRTLGLPIVGAIAAATLLIGGLAGGIIGYAVHSDGPDLGDRGDRPGMGPGAPDRGGS